LKFVNGPESAHVREIDPPDELGHLRLEPDAQIGCAAPADNHVISAVIADRLLGNAICPVAATANGAASPFSYSAL
jgi:hypothetical protein